MRPRAAAALMAAALLAAGCGVAPDSGVEGIVMAGPMCPGPMRQGHPCPDRAVAVHLQALRFPPGFTGVPTPQRARLVARFASAAGGRFRVALPPGAYLLYGDRRLTGYMVCQASVTVPPRGWAHATVVCDTGLR